MLCVKIKEHQGTNKKKKNKSTKFYNVQCTVLKCIEMENNYFKLIKYFPIILILLYV